MRVPFAPFLIVAIAATLSASDASGDFFPLGGTLNSEAYFQDNSSNIYPSQTLYLLQPQFSGPPYAASGSISLPLTTYTLSDGDTATASAMASFFSGGFYNYDYSSAAAHFSLGGPASGSASQGTFAEVSSFASLGPNGAVYGWISDPLVSGYVSPFDSITLQLAENVMTNSGVIDLLLYHSYPPNGYLFAGTGYFSISPYFNASAPIPFSDGIVSAEIQMSVTITHTGGSGDSWVSFFGDPGISVPGAQPIPEPSTLVLSSIVLGMFGAIWSYKRRRDGVRLCSWFLRAVFETKNKV